eukprot:4446682-Pyramimonas_sp.AAC.1
MADASVGLEGGGAVSSESRLGFTMETVEALPVDTPSSSSRFASPSSTGSVGGRGNATWLPIDHTIRRSSVISTNFNFWCPVGVRHISYYTYAREPMWTPHQLLASSSGTGESIHAQYRNTLRVPKTPCVGARLQKVVGNRYLTRHVRGIQAVTTASG